MLTPQDTPTAEDMLRLHQWTGKGGQCQCGVVVQRSADRSDAAMAIHQLGQLAAAGLAVVSVHGTAAVVKQAAVVVGLIHPGCDAGEVHDALMLLRQRLEALAK